MPRTIATAVVGAIAAAAFVIAVPTAAHAATSVGGPYSVPEGSDLTLAGTNDVGNSTYSWVITNGASSFSYPSGSATQVVPVYPALAFVGLVDGPANGTVAVQSYGPGGYDPGGPPTTLMITNVAPTATLGNSGPVQLGHGATVSFSGQSDPSSADTAAGFRYAYDFDIDGTWEIGNGTYAGGVTSGWATIPASYLNAGGPFTVRGRILDKDGGFTDVSTVITVNEGPLANAGPDQAVNLGDTVTLDGTGSDDLESDPLTYSWVQTGGGTVVALAGASTAQPTFTSPEGPDVLVFQLTVDDGNGGTDQDTVAVTVNGPPTADASIDLGVPAGAAVFLDASGSTDPDGNSLTYAWTQIAGTTVVLTGANTAQPSFTAPFGSSTLTFRVTVDDGHGRTDVDEVTITVSAPPVPPDRTPPTVALSSPTPDPVTGPFTVDIAFSEVVTGLGLDDLTVTNGTASRLVGGATTYSVTITPTAEGPVTVTVGVGAATDSAGNPSTASPTLTRTYDDGVEVEPPVLQVTTDHACVGPGARLGVSVTSLEPTSFELDASHPGLLRGLRMTDQGLTFRPVAGASGTTSVTISATNSGGTSTLVIRVVVGSSAADRLRGSSGTDVLLGSRGDDVLRGLAGRDLICGGAGDDTLRGGAGDDVLDGGPGRNSVIQ